MLVIGAAGCFVFFAITLSVNFSMQARRQRDVLASNDPDRIPRVFKRKLDKKGVPPDKRVEEYRKMTSGGMTGLQHQHPFIGALVGSFIITVILGVLNILVILVRARLSEESVTKPRAKEQNGQLPLDLDSPMVTKPRAKGHSKWPPDTGYLSPPANRPSRPHDVKPASTNILIFAVNEKGFLFKGNTDWRDSEQLLVYPGSQIAYFCKSPSAFTLEDFNGDPCTIKYGMTVRVDEYGVFVFVRSGEIPKEFLTVNDRPPTISLEQPAGNIFVTPDAVVPLRVLVKDDIAIHTIQLRYAPSDRAKQNDQSQRAIELYSGPDKAPKTNIGDLHATAEPADTRLIEYRWDLARLESLEPGMSIELLVVQATTRSKRRKVRLVSCWSSPPPNWRTALPNGRRTYLGNSPKCW